MRFTKFFRRYSRTLLMVFMSLLLVVFLLGDVLQSMGRNPREQKAVIGHSVDGDVYNTDVAEAMADQQVLARLGFAMANMIQPLDLHLLMQEAKRMGISVGRDEVNVTLAQMGRTPEQVQLTLNGLQSSTRRSTQNIYDLLGRWLAVSQMFTIQGEALDQSAPRTEVAYRNGNQKADVQVSVIDSRAFVNRTSEPTAEELQAFFEANKDRFPAHTDDKLEFGYRLPDRVRVEYLTIDPKTLEPKVHARERDLEKYFQENARNYTKTVAPDTAATTRPTQTTVQMTFEEAKDKVRQDFIRGRAIEAAQRLLNQVRESAYRPWQAQPADPQGFRPDLKETPVSFKDLRDQYANEADLIYQQTPLMSQQELQNLLDNRPEFLKQAGDQFPSPEPVYVESTNRIPLSEFAFRVKGLYTPKSEERLPVLNLLEPSPVINSRQPTPGSIGRRGSRPELIPYQPYMFRVVQAEPACPPASLDQVREQVRSDYRLMKAHALAGEAARQLADSARTAGLPAAVEQAAELKQIFTAADPTPAVLNPDPATPPPASQPYAKELGPNVPLQPVTRDSTRLGQYLSDSSKVPHEIFKAVDSAGSTSAPGHTVVVGDVAKLFKWAVVEVTGVKPIYRGEFEQQRARLQSSNTLDREVLGGWIDPTNIQLRNGFTYTNPAATRPASE